MAGKPGRKLNREPRHMMIPSKEWIKTREERKKARKAEEEERLAAIAARVEAERSRCQRDRKSAEFTRKLNGMADDERRAFIMETVRGLFRNGWTLEVMQSGKRRTAQRMPRKFQPISLQMNGDGTNYNGMFYAGENKKLSIFMIHPQRTTDDQD